jgi:hypothetical protein
MDDQQLAADPVDQRAEERERSRDEKQRVHSLPSAIRAIFRRKSCRSHPLKGLMSDQ